METEQAKTDKTLDLNSLLAVSKPEGEQQAVEKAIKAVENNQKIKDVVTLVFVRVWKPLLMLVALGFHHYAKQKYQNKTINLTTKEDKTDGRDA